MTLDYPFERFLVRITGERYTFDKVFLFLNGESGMYTALLALLSREIEEVAQTVKVCSARLKRHQEFRARNEDDILADSLAACLHSFYTGLENIFKSIAEEIDEGGPKGERWHKQLLLLMATAIPGTRPAILSREGMEKLENFRSFRHLFRNLYTHNLLSERVFALAGQLEGTWVVVSRDLRDFLNFLEEINSGR